MVVRERLYTIEEFWELVRLPENQEKRLEWEDGVVIDMGSSSRLNTVTAMRIAHFMSNHVIPNNLGFITGADAGYYLKALKRVRQPDVAFIAKSHGVLLEGVEFDIAPDIAVEVVSPDEDIHKKAREYLLSGTAFVWAIYAQDKAVYVMTLNNKGAVMSLPFTGDDILDGGEVLPGFRLAVKDIFPE
jgi:Uma2 family endonuclease